MKALAKVRQRLAALSAAAAARRPKELEQVEVKQQKRKQKRTAKPLKKPERSPRQRELRRLDREDFLVSRLPLERRLIHPGRDRPPRTVRFHLCAAQSTGQAARPNRA